MINEVQVPLFDVTMCLSNAVDLISPTVFNHHKQVAYIAAALADEIGLSNEEQGEIILAGTLHDIGAMSLKEKLDGLNFELDSPYKHAEIGYLLLKTYAPFARIAEIVRHHHLPWKETHKPVPLGSYILHLADRVAVLIDPRQEVLGQVEGIVRTINKESGNKFMPDLVRVFTEISRRESFWLDIVSPILTPVLTRKAKLINVVLNLEGLMDLTKLISRIIDFRSSFTAIHSSGVAATAEKLAELAGWSKLECRMIRISGYLHDLGKLAIPLEILEKPNKLTSQEFQIIKSHPFYTYRLLESINGLTAINAWASLHHERLDGTGYPFHFNSKDLLIGSRIVAVADIFTAITEDRPYRKGMPANEALKVLQRMADNLALDDNLVGLMKQNYAEIGSVRLAAQAEATGDYRQFRLQYD